MNILITGVSGFIGKRLAGVLSNNDFRLYGADIKELNDNELHSKLEKFTQCDLSDKSQASEICRDMDTIIHLAGEASVQATGSSHHKNTIINSRNIFEAALICGAKKIIYLSSIKASDNGNYGMSKKTAENMLIDMLSGTAIKYTILRSPPVYAPGMKGNIAGWLRLLKYRLCPAIPDNPSEIEMIGLDDLCRAIGICITDGRTDDKTYKISDGRVYAINLIEGRVRELFKCEKPLFTMPGSLMYGIAKIGDCLNNLGFRFPFGTTGYMILFENRVKPDYTFQVDTGFEPRQHFLQEISTIFLQKSEQ